VWVVCVWVHEREIERRDTVRQTVAGGYQPVTMGPWAAEPAALIRSHIQRQNNSDM